MNVYNHWLLLLNEIDEIIIDGGCAGLRDLSDLDDHKRVRFELNRRRRNQTMSKLATANVKLMVFSVGPAMSNVRFYFFSSSHLGSGVTLTTTTM